LGPFWRFSGIASAPPSASLTTGTIPTYRQAGGFRPYADPGVMKGWPWLLLSPRRRSACCVAPRALPRPSRQTKEKTKKSSIIRDNVVSS